MKISFLFFLLRFLFFFFFLLINLFACALLFNLFNLFKSINHLFMHTIRYDTELLYFTFNLYNCVYQMERKLMARGERRRRKKLLWKKKKKKKKRINTEYSSNQALIFSFHFTPCARPILSHLFIALVKSHWRPAYFSTVHLSVHCFRAIVISEMVSSTKVGLKFHQIQKN